ncbi:hypothetical protein EB118_11515 [bacterium]|nr:hypothetical protein [bacterium]
MKDESHKKPIRTIKTARGGTLLQGSHGKETGRPKGSRNRSTIVREWLEALYTKTNPISGKPEKLSIQDHMVISLIGKALKGDVPAFKELMDSGHGKIIDGLDVTSKGESIVAERLSPEERRMLIDKLRSDMGANNG